MRDAARLDHIRRRLEAIGKPRWMLVADGAAMVIEGTDAGGARERICGFETATMDEIELILAAPDDLRFLLMLLDHGAAHRNDHGPASNEPREALKGGTDKGPGSGLPLKAGTETPNYSAEAAMVCDRPAWGRFLAERAGARMPADAGATAVLLRAALGVKSRAELNHDAAAAARWRSLRLEFMAWLNGYGGGGA